MTFIRSLATGTFGAFFAALALAALLGVPAAPAAAEDDPVIARANGVDIHQSDLALAEDEIGSTFRTWRRNRSANTSSPIWPT